MKAAFFTLGCKVNQYETQIMEQAFQKAGFEIVDPESEADVYVVNSCTVTGVGDKKSRQMLRHFRRKNPNAVIALTGCYPQAFPEEAAALMEADVITGSADRSQLLPAVLDAIDGKRVVHVTPHGDDETFEPMQAEGMLDRTRAFVKIEDGCDSRCAYCIIPKARGPVRSKAPGDVIAEVRDLAKAGVKEVILTGIETAAYGRDFSGGYSLADLLEEVSLIDGVERIRMGSLEPSSMRDGFIRRIADLPKVMPHFHLSLQSGCSRTLSSMRRKYNADQAAEIIESIHSYIPDAMLSADIIAGFPGESDEDFAKTVGFLRNAHLLHIHAFPFSVRAGTEAAQMEGQLPEAVKKARVGQLCALDCEIRSELLADYSDTHKSKPVNVLCETWHDGVGRGHSEHFVEVEFEACRDVSGQICSVSLSKADGNICFGKADIK